MNVFIVVRHTALGRDDEKESENLAAFWTESDARTFAAPLEDSVDRWHEIVSQEIEGACPWGCANCKP